VVKEVQGDKNERDDNSKREKKLVKWWFPTSTITETENHVEVKGLPYYCGVAGELFHALVQKGGLQKYSSWKKACEVPVYQCSSITQGDINSLDIIQVTLKDVRYTSPLSL